MLDNSVNKSRNLNEKFIPPNNKPSVNNSIQIVSHFVKSNVLRERYLSEFKTVSMRHATVDYKSLFDANVIREKIPDNQNNC